MSSACGAGYTVTLISPKVSLWVCMYALLGGKAKYAYLITVMVTVSARSSSRIFKAVDDLISFCLFFRISSPTSFYAFVLTLAPPESAYTLQLGPASSSASRGMVWLLRCWRMRR